LLVFELTLLDKVLSKLLHAHDTAVLLIFVIGVRLLNRSIRKVNALFKFVTFAKVVGAVILKREPDVSWVSQHKVGLSAGNEHKESDVIFAVFDERWLFDILLGNKAGELVCKSIQVVHLRLLFHLILLLLVF
jgi:hypothetical protein